ncbi:alpha/beta-hydrolase [Marasmius fiardii PR-910]|nr:alpha/beta-hydrolase [Marasmius fiardii PR-910]
MPVNALTRNVGLRVGPIFLERLVRHYFDRLKNDFQQKEEKTKDVQLRQDELLYDEAFHIIKAFLDAAQYHTVEEVQEFANYRTISPPWVQVVRVIVPMSCCDDAAGCLIKALGGEAVAQRVVGGTKWWQVRSINGVDAQWILAKKDWQEHKRRYKMQDRASREKEAGVTEESGTYQKDMDEMRCILYSHGGGYYFGSVDQERYVIQRYARKINGRVFAINYRLAPQYPFPCALQDLIAAYLYLIRPPPEAKHTPVQPGHIIIAGDSAGGGLSLALLQVIRDSGLPMPAGGVLVSPWCDLTHSFPSIHTNTDTDVIPQYGLALHKPSTLWPPPSPEMTRGVHNGLRSRIRQTFKMEDKSFTSTVLTFNQNSTDAASKMPVDVGATTPLPQPDSSNTFEKQAFSLTTKNGEVLTVDSQLQLYTVNSLLFHPLVSPALSYLGGLPPLLFIASDKEVLKDEIVYTAHKAAYPERYPVKDEVRSTYPCLHGIEDRFGATPVHLQIYDDTAHILPVLFPFTTPGKFCHRAIASFCRHVTKMTFPSTPVTDSFASTSDTSHSRVQSLKATKGTLLGPISSVARKSSVSSIRGPSKKSSLDSRNTGDSAMQDPSHLHRSLSESVKGGIRTPQKRPSSILPLEERQSQGSSVELGSCPPFSAPPVSFVVSQDPPSNSSEPDDFVEPKFVDMISSPPSTLHEERYAGDPIVYSESADFPSMRTTMIRERVSTRGLVRLLEPEFELDACCVPHKMIGALSELAIRRYFDGRKKFDSKFASTMRAIENHRRKHLERAKKDTIRNMNVLQNSLEREEQLKKEEGFNSAIKEGLLASSGWSWAWALDTNEHPPPSSIVSRRDTSEALELARIADRAVLQDEVFGDLSPIY